MIKSGSGPIYDIPQLYPLKERIEIIRKELNAGNSFLEIAEKFGVVEDAIKYYYKRYILKENLPLSVRKKMIQAKGRYRYLRKIREEGKSFKEIGTLLNVSSSRARQLYLMSLKLPPSIYNKKDVYTEFLKEIEADDGKI